MVAKQPLFPPYLCRLHTFCCLVACVLDRSREYGTEIASSRLVKSRSRVELNSTGSDQVVLGLRPAATLMQVSVGRGTLKWVCLRGIRHKNNVNERPETLATSSMERALMSPFINPSLNKQMYKVAHCKLLPQIKIQ